VKIDLHCHSEASFDCVVPLMRLLERAQERGIQVQALTDHNEIWGAQELQRLADARRDAHPGTPLTIVGEEVSTTEGELIGLFLRELIPKGLSPEETVSRIKAQGGLVLLPHGFDPLKKHRLKPEAVERIAADIDIVETFNARVSKPRWNQAAAAWAEARGLAKSGGSDAHTLADIGAAWTETDTPAADIATPEGLLRALRAGTVSGRWTHPLVAFAYKVWDSGFKITARYLGGR
jgi:predicted metal-dependent phosphoesterase TrpH